MNVLEKFSKVSENIFVSSYGRVVKADGEPNTTEWRIRYELATTIEGSFVYVWIKGTRLPLHKLVAGHFMDEPSGKWYVNHMDGEARNNFVGNLTFEKTKRYPRFHDVPTYHGGRVYKVINNRIFRTLEYVKRSDAARIVNELERGNKNITLKLAK
jgi:hypothetical protein